MPISQVFLGQLVVEQVQADEHPFPVREITNDPAHRWRQDFGEGGGGQDLVLLGQLGVFKHVNHLQRIDPQKLGLEDVAQGLEGPHRVGRVARHVELEDVGLTGSHGSEAAEAAKRWGRRGLGSCRSIKRHRTAVHLTEVGHHIKEGKPVVLQEVVLISLQLELRGEPINQIHVNLYSFGDR